MVYHVLCSSLVCIRANGLVVNCGLHQCRLDKNCAKQFLPKGQSRQKAGNKIKMSKQKRIEWLYQPLFLSEQQDVAEFASIVFHRNGTVILGNRAYAQGDTIDQQLAAGTHAMRANGSYRLMVKKLLPTPEIYVFDYRKSFFFSCQWYRAVKREYQLRPVNLWWPRSKRPR